MSLTVYIAEPHAYARVGLERLLRRAGHRIALTPAEADLTIIGLSVDRTSGLEAARRLRMRRPDHPILVLLPPSESLVGELAVRDGVDGYLLLSQSGRSVDEACRAVNDGRTYRPPPVGDGH